MSDSIFTPEPPAVFPSPVDNSVQDLTATFHSNSALTDSKEPEWHAKLLAAKSEQEKQEILNARAAWQEEAQFIVHKARLEEHQVVVDAVLSVPVTQRTKQYYDSLELGSLYFDPRIQKQMRSDKQTLNLGFYLKSKG